RATWRKFGHAYGKTRPSRTTRTGFAGQGTAAAEVVAESTGNRRKHPSSRETHRKPDSFDTTGVQHAVECRRHARSERAGAHDRTARDRSRTAGSANRARKYQSGTRSVPEAESRRATDAFRESGLPDNRQDAATGTYGTKRIFRAKSCNSSKFDDRE